MARVQASFRSLFDRLRWSALRSKYWRWSLPIRVSAGLSRFGLEASARRRSSYTSSFITGATTAEVSRITLPTIRSRGSVPPRRETSAAPTHRRVSAATLRSQGSAAAGIPNRSRPPGRQASACVPRGPAAPPPFRLSVRPELHWFGRIRIDGDGKLPCRFR